MAKGFGKIAKWVGIVVAVLLVLIVAAAVIIPPLLPLDKIKNMAADKASQAIHRQVTIGKVSFNIFTGITLNDISVSNRPGYSKEPFVSCKNIALKYDLWKLLRGTVYIDKVVLLDPQILVETKDGVSNYADLVGVKKPETKTEAKTKEPVSLMVSTFSVVNGTLTMNTFVKGEKETMQAKDLNLTLSDIALVTKKPMTLNVGLTGVYQGHPVPVTITGKIDLDLGKMYAKIYNLAVIAAGDKLNFDIEATNFDKAPVVKMTVTSQKIDAEKFLEIITGPKKVLPYGVATANMNKSLKSVPANMKLSMMFDINNILYKEMKLDSLSGKLSMANKVVAIELSGVKAYKGAITGKINADLNVSGIAYKLTGISGKGFDASPAANDVVGSFLTKLPNYQDMKNKVEGALSFDVSLTGKGIETQDMIANANGSGNFKLVNGKIAKISSLAAIGDKIGLKTLSNDIDLKEFKSNFSVANKIVTIKGLTLNNGDTGDIKLAFDGSANIATLAFLKGNTLSLKLNPKSTKLSSEYDAFKDASGWYSLDFEMTGSLKKPIPLPKLGAPVQQIVNNKKKELETAAQKAIDAKKKEVQDKAQQELENKAKGLLKF
jgi:uncharacterized protein involved in outer membrane biogenesis